MNTTTVKQSLVLMDAGIDPATADMAYIKNPRDGHYLLTATKPMSKSDLPCWSMGALWEICRQRAIGLEFLTDEDDTETVISTMVKTIFDDVEEKTQNS
jgi:hypothetical protein